VPTYISLCNITDQGMRTIKDVRTRARRTEQLARELGCNLTPYPTLGPYDVVFLLEAPDDQAATRFFLRIGAEGNLRTMTLKAIPREEFFEAASSVE
jgi:uncharacterized protein with GYD domain